MSRSVSGLPDNPDDYATACGNYDTPEREPGPDDAPLDARGREMTCEEMAAEVRRICGPALDRIRALEQSAHRCECGMNLERSRCATCAPLTREELGL